MSTLFLIGNGFDLNCGMKTSYKDVYKMYIKEPSATKCISEFKSMLSENIDSWGDFEMSMAGYAAYMKSEDDFLECVRDFASYMEGYLVNEKNKFREIIHEEKLHTEVMKEIEDSLSNFYKGITHNVDRVIDNRASEFIAEMCAITFNYTDIFDTFFTNIWACMLIMEKKLFIFMEDWEMTQCLELITLNKLKQSFNFLEKEKEDL